MMKFILDIVSTPAILVALIAILGLVLQKKKLPDIIKGGIKTFVGFLVVSGGAGIVQNSLNPFGTMFEHAFHLSGVVPNNEAIVAVALTTYGSATAMIMFAGMVFNILIARFTRFKYIFLTGHHTLYMACMIAVILSVAGFTSLPLILLGGLALGIIMSISPAFVQKYMVQLTGNDKVALGHFSSLGYWLSGFTGSLIGDKSKSTEDIKFPKSLAFLRDSTVSITLSMAVIYIIVAIFAGSEYIEKEISSGTSGLVYALQLAGQFAAGVFVILAGVRLILGEIVPAFKGISERLVPNSKPALDCPIVYTYAPNAVLIGFISSFVGGLVSMANYDCFRNGCYLTRRCASFLLWSDCRCYWECIWWCSWSHYWSIFTRYFNQFSSSLFNASFGRTWFPRINFLRCRFWSIRNYFRNVKSIWLTSRHCDWSCSYFSSYVWSILY